MGKTNIQYADEVSNPLMARPIGDESVKIGTFCEKPDKDGTCKNCWAEVLNLRFGNKLTFDKSNRDKIEWIRREKEIKRLLMRNRQKAKSAMFPGLPLVVFCCDTFDIFQPSITDELRDWVFDNYDRCTDLILLIQSTYPAKMSNYFKARYGAEKLPSHYWIGMSAGTQKFYDQNINYLHNINASQKYVIFEPLLENINLKLGVVFVGGALCRYDKFDNFFFIVGGESGNGARPCDIAWMRSIVNQCKSANVACFVKQLGSNAENSQLKDIWHNGNHHYTRPNGDEIIKQAENNPTYTITNQKLNRHLSDKKGGNISEFPEDLQIRQFPEGVK